MSFFSSVEQLLIGHPILPYFFPIIWLSGFRVRYVEAEELPCYPQTSIMVSTAGEPSVWCVPNRGRARRIAPGLALCTSVLASCVTLVTPKALGPLGLREKACTLEISAGPCRSVERGGEHVCAAETLNQELEQRHHSNEGHCQLQGLPLQVTN